MMRRRSLLARLLPLVVLWLAAPAATAGGSVLAAPAGITVSELLADPAGYAGQVVVVRGELVGDFGERRDGTVWTQLNGDPYAETPLLGGGSLAGANVGIGVRVPAAVWPGFDGPGGYRLRGPVVEATGVWRYHDPARGGESYLDVTVLELILEPLVLEEGMAWLPLLLGFGLLGTAAAVAVVKRRRTGD